jgi:excinuclease ABC subunit C
MPKTNPLNQKIRTQLASLPKKAGCYLFRDPDGQVLYVGKAKVLRQRVRSYFQDGASFNNPAKFSMIQRIEDIETIIVTSEMEALILESTLIKKYEPRYNVLLKDDKHYLFIKVTVQEDYPKVLTVRRVDKDGARYFGPFTSSFAVRDTLRLLQKVFPYRTCDLELLGGGPGTPDAGAIQARGYRPCLRYHLGRCDAPCIEGVSREQYRAVIDKVLLFLEGKLDFVTADLTREMNSSAKRQDFERAARLRDQIAEIAHLTAKQVVLSPKFTNQDVVGFVTDRRRTRAFASLMMIREGKVLGQEHFVLTIDPSNTDEEIVRRLVLQHYQQATFVPRELIVPVRLSDANAIIKLLQRQAASMHLEHAIRIVVPRTGSKKRLLAMTEENAMEFRARKTAEWTSGELNTTAALRRLAQAIGWRDTNGSSKIPQRVEIYDMSNIQGTSAVGSMVVFTDGKPNKAEYRRFKIVTLKEEPNDVGMMKEVLRRRLRRLVNNDPRWPRPDLIIVDGGKPQLGAAVSILHELDLDIPVVGLAKREEEIFVPKRKQSVRLERGTAALHLVQRMRDEAHRFAITFHRQVRSGRNRRSLLDEIVGIGPKRKKILIQRYGSLSAVADASQTELGKLIGSRAAKALLEQLSK